MIFEKRPAVQECTVQDSWRKGSEQCRVFQSPEGGLELAFLTGKPTCTNCKLKTLSGRASYHKRGSNQCRWEERIQSDESKVINTTVTDTRRNYNNLPIVGCADGAEGMTDGVTDGTEGTTEGRRVGNDGTAVGLTVSAPADDTKYNSRK